jgi:hypothetical protein
VTHHALIERCRLTAEVSSHLLSLDGLTLEGDVQAGVLSSGGPALALAVGAGPDGELEALVAVVGDLVVGVEGLALLVAGLAVVGVATVDAVGDGEGAGHGGQDEAGGNDGGESDLHLER